MNDPSRQAAREHLAQMIPGLDQSVFERIPAHAPDWTGHTDSDPGITLLELFAFLAEGLIYRRMEPSALPHTAETAGPLRELLDVIAGEASSIRDELEKLYGDQFAATAEAASFGETRFPGVFVDEVPFQANPIPGVSTTLNPRLGVDRRIPGKFPAKIEAPDLNATGNEVPIEPLELVNGQLEDPDPDDD